MRVSAEMLVEGAYAAWAVRDISSALACFSEDVTYIIHLPPELGPFSGEVQGRAGLRGRLAEFMDAFDVLEYVPLQIRAHSAMSHSRIRFAYRHKATGLTYEGRLRHVWRVDGARIVWIEEFHDVARVRTFFRLIEHAGREQRT